MAELGSKRDLPPNCGVGKKAVSSVDSVGPAPACSSVSASLGREGVLWFSRLSPETIKKSEIAQLEPPNQ